MFWIAENLVDFIMNGRSTFLLEVWGVGILEYSLFTMYYTRYKPYDNNFRIPVSIVIPVFREEPYLFMRCLESIKRQLKDEDELLIIFDGNDKELRKVAEDVVGNDGIILVKEHGGKRSTLGYGCDNTKNELIITIDSDTVLSPDCIDKIVMPFKDEKIGAVSGYQRIFNADMNLSSKFADYNEILSHGFLQKATSAAGNVPVLYGRCLAMRKIVWSRIGERYKNKLFMGNKVESGDDNDLTVLTIGEGWRTFMQESAKVSSDCPRDWLKRLKQQYRFNRSSMRVTLTDWLTDINIIKRAKLGFINQLTAIIFPFLVMGVWVEWISHMVWSYQTLINLSLGLLVVTSIMTLFTTIGLRYIILLEKKEDIPSWLAFSLYSWSVLNILNIVSILTIFREKPHLVQYSRNK